MENQENTINTINGAIYTDCPFEYARNALALFDGDSARAAKAVINLPGLDSEFKTAVIYQLGKA